MKDEELNLEEIEASQTLGGVGEVVRGAGSGEGQSLSLPSDTLRDINFAKIGII